MADYSHRFRLNPNVLSTLDPNHSPICMHGYVQRPNFRVYAEVSKLPKFVHI
jgi:ribosomal protein S8